MQLKHKAFFSAALLIPVVAFCQDDQMDKQRARDRSAYVLDLTSQPMKEMCAGVVNDYANLFDLAYPAWLEANKESIQRGREETRLSFGRKGDIDAYETTTLAEFRTQLSKMAKDTKKSRCLAALRAFGATP